MTPLIHVWATAEEDRAEFIPTAGYTHTHALIETHAAVVHTDTLDVRSIHFAQSDDETSDCSFLMLVIGVILEGVERGEDDSLGELVIDREMAGTSLITDPCVLGWLQSNWKGNRGPLTCRLRPRAF